MYPQTKNEEFHYHERYSSTLFSKELKLLHCVYFTNGRWSQQILTYILIYLLSCLHTYLLTKVQDLSSSQVVDQNDSLFYLKKIS